VAGTAVYVVWEDKTTENGNSDIFLRISPNGGFIFKSVINLSQNDGSSDEPRIAVDATGTAYVVWEDFSTNVGPFGNGDIFFKKSNGSTLNLSITAPCITGLHHCGDSYVPRRNHDMR